MADSSRTTILAALVLLASALSAPAQIPLGSEFRVDRSGSVNAQTIGTTPRSAAVTQDGTFILTWVRDDWPNKWIMGRIVEPNGKPRPQELLINTSTTSFSENDAVAMDDAGNFVVVWTRNAYQVRGRIGYGAEFQVGTSQKSQPAVAAAPDGKFVVVWTAYDGDSAGIFGQRFEADGAPIGGEFQVNTDTTGQQALPSVDGDAAGNFVVVWASLPSGDVFVLGQRFTAAGVRQGAEFTVSVAPFESPWGSHPRVSRAASGPFIVVWEKKRASNAEIAARRFDAGGAPVGAEFWVNTYTSGIQDRPDVDMDLDGDFVIAWTSEYQDGSDRGVFARRFEATGGTGAEFRVNTYTTNRQWMPRIAVDPAGNFVVGWQANQNGESTLQAQRYAGGLSAAALAVDTSAGATSDGNGVLEPGETVTVAPSWLNAGFAAATFSGTAVAFDGPPMPGTTYTIADGAASYGTVASNATGSCGATSDCYALGVTVPSTAPPQHWDASFREVISPANLGALKNWTLHIGDSFGDVPRASGFYRFVETVLHHSVTGGCNATQYCPLAGTTREQMAVFVLVAKEGAGYVPPACTTPMFSDVPASSPYCRWIEELARRGVVNGCGGGNYCPADAVSREQMAVFVLLTKEPGLAPLACATPMFNDVPASSTFCRWIEELARRGVVSGCGGGNYCPTAAVTREQMAVFISVTFGLALYGP